MGFGKHYTLSFDRFRVSFGVGSGPCSEFWGQVKLESLTSKIRVFYQFKLIAHVTEFHFYFAGVSCIWKRTWIKSKTYWRRFCTINCIFSRWTTVINIQCIFSSFSFAKSSLHDLQIMVCSYAVQSKCVLLQIIFCSWMRNCDHAHSQASLLGEKWQIPLWVVREWFK